MLRLTQLWLAAGMLAAGFYAFTAASAWAFSQEIVWPGSGKSTTANTDNQFSDPDDQNSEKGMHPFGSSGPVVQFGVQQGTLTPFGLRNNDDTSTPDPYYKPLFRGN